MFYIRKIKCKVCKIVKELMTSQATGRIDYTCSDCNPSHIYTSFTPAWVNTVKPNLGKMDAEHDTKVTEAMLSEREKETKLSRKARDWEQGRKSELLKFKPQWVKRGRKMKDLPK